jgi:hypothetical protein
MDLKVKKELFAVAQNKGDINAFIEKNKNAFIIEAKGSSEVLFSLFEANAIANQTPFGNDFLEKFNKERSKRLVDYNADRHDVKLVSEKMLEAFSADPEIIEGEIETTEPQLDENGNVKEKFNTTVAETGGGLNVMGGLIATNVRTVIDKYFYDSPIMRAITLLDNKDGNAEIITDFTNERTAVSAQETTVTTAQDNTTLSDTIQPTIRIIDRQELSSLFREVVTPTTFAKIITKMERAIIRMMEVQIIGATGSSTNGTNQFYSILNNLGGGVTRGSIALTLPLSGTAGGVKNDIDAVNYAISQLPLYDVADIPTTKIGMNFVTWCKIMRSFDANNNYYFNKETKKMTSLIGDTEVLIFATMPDDLVLVGDFSNYIVKLLRSPALKAYSYEDKDVLVEDTFADGTPSMAYKTIPTKNGFRHFTLKANYAV